MILALAIFSLLLHGYFGIVLHWSGNAPLQTTILLALGIGYSLFLTVVWLKKRSAWTYFHFPLVFLIPTFLGYQQEKKFEAYAVQQKEKQIQQNKKLIDAADALFSCNQNRIAAYFSSAPKLNHSEDDIQKKTVSSHINTKKGYRLILLPESLDALPETLCIWQETKESSNCYGFDRQKKETQLECKNTKLGSLDTLRATKF